MTDDEIIDLAHKAGNPAITRYGLAVVTIKWMANFAAIVSAAEREAEREVVAHWMRSMGYATDHSDTIEDLLGDLRTQIAEGLEAEREACAKVCETTDEPLDPSAAGGVFAAAIRARSKT